MRVAIKLIIVCTAVLLIVYSCDNKNNPIEKKGRLVVKLTSGFETDTSINIELKSVLVQYANLDEESGDWTELTTNDRVYNMYTLQDSNDVVIAQDELSVGKIMQLKLVLGSDNSLLTETDTFDIELPEEYFNGFEININDSIKANEEIAVILDVSSKSSLIDKGNGLFSFVPVISVVGNN